MRSGRVSSLRIAALPEKAQVAFRVAIFEGAHSIKNHIVESMNLPKSGRMYGDHQASAPGESPAIDTRNLVDDVRALIAQDGLSAKIGVLESDTSSYGQYLEDSRPWLQPAFNANIEGIRTAFKNAFKK